MKNTISIHVGGNYSVIHNNRLTVNHSNPDIDIKRSKKNIVLIDEPIRKKYDEIFGKAVEEFNKKQKRNDRKIGNYFQKIRDSQLDEAKEVIFEIGNSEDLKKLAEEKQCEIWETKEWKLRTKVLENYVQDFQKNNPNFVVFNAAIHLDETNPHAHVDFIPVATHMKKGLSKQVSMNGALSDMGYNEMQFVVRERGVQAGKTIVQPDNQKNFSEWRETQMNAFKTLSREIYQAYGETFEFTEGSKRKEHFHVAEFKQRAEEAKSEIKALQGKEKIKQVRLAFNILDVLPEEINQPEDYESFVTAIEGEAFDNQKFSFSNFLIETFAKVTDYLQKQLEKIKEKEREAHILDSKRSEAKKVLGDQEEQIKANKSLLRAQEDKLKTFEETIEGILDHRGVVRRQAEEVYYYDGRTSPECIGTVQEVLEAHAEDENYEVFSDQVSEEVLDNLWQPQLDLLEEYKNHTLGKSEVYEALEAIEKEGEGRFLGQRFYINPTKEDFRKINAKYFGLRTNMNLEDFTAHNRIQSFAERAIQNPVPLPRSRGRSI